MKNFLKIINRYFKILIDAHKFFVKISPDYMQGTPRLSYYCRYPFVYLKFMYHTFAFYRKSNSDA